MSHAVVDGPEVVLAATQQVYVVYVIREFSSMTRSLNVICLILDNDNVESYGKLRRWGPSQF